MQLSSSSFGKNWTIGIVFFACLAAVLPAMGKKESDFRPAEGKESWAHRYDISELPAGKYNLIIEGKDRAGNASTAGPFNVFVDPMSDLPLTGVSNPTPGMRVGGVLNIVGTCVDDDGVGHVEVRLDDGDFVQATGTEYWSYTLDVSAVPDGEHRVTAQGIDVNGKTGNPVSVAFQLDTIKPLVRMSSHESGALVSGQVNLAGSVEDANGVRSLAWSADDRKTWNELPVKQARNRTSAPFELKVDTRKLGDGPHVYWFKGFDRTGSEGYLAFLLFVDNTGPALEILKPAPEEKVSGRTVVVGKVAEQLGVQSLAYEGGDGNTGTIELTPGDPYWTCVLDFSRAKGSAARVTFTVIDRVGNRTARQVSFPLLDDKADLAVVTLRSPAAEGRYGTEALLSGMVRDDDGVKGVQYSLDGGAPVLVPGSETFAVPLPGLLPGRHKLSVRGIDLNDRPGGEQVVEFTALGTPPVVTLESAAGKGGAVPFRPGLEVNRLDGVVLAGKVATAGRIQGLELSLNGGAPAKLPAPRAAGKGTKQPDGAGGTSFELRLPPDLPFGLLPFTVRATDELGQVGELKSLLRVSNLSRRNIEPGIYFTDSRLQPDGTVLLQGPEPLSGIFAEEEIDSVGLEPDTGLVSVAAEGDRLVVTPRKAGISEPVRIRVVSTRRHVFLSDAFRFVTDGGKPEVAITTPRSGEWLARGLEVTGTASDATGIAALEYSLDGMKSWAPVDTAAGRAETFRPQTAPEPRTASASSPRWRPCPTGWCTWPSAPRTGRATPPSPRSPC